MGIHSEYGKRVLTKAAGADFHALGPSVEIDYGCGNPARIDGTIANLIAVEVESRVGKQVRGAVMDLLCHPFPKKMLILQEVHMSDVEECAEQCRTILARFGARTSDFEVVVLNGTGRSESFQEDVQRVREAVSRLRASAAAAST